jgi:hypothetical protein
VTSKQPLQATMPTHAAGEIEAQYAASDRAQCKKCRMSIDKGALRIGEWYAWNEKANEIFFFFFCKNFKFPQASIDVLRRIDCELVSCQVLGIESESENSYHRRHQGKSSSCRTNGILSHTFISKIQTFRVYDK